MSIALQAAAQLDAPRAQASQQWSHHMPPAYTQWGPDPEDNTWEPESELMRKCSTIIDAYWALVKGQAEPGKDTNAIISKHSSAKRIRCQ